MTMSLARLVSVLILGGILLGAASSSAAQSTDATTDWMICNDSSYIARTATGYSRNDTLTLKGWSEVIPGECIVEQVPVLSARFLYAESLALHHGGIREWKGENAFCVADSDFTLQTPGTCDGPDQTLRNYLAIRPGEPETRLGEPADYSPRAAQIAATQRLLRDAGYPVTQIDGLAGRGTSRLIRRFRRDAGLASSVDEADLIRALMKRVEELNESVGLEVCNDSGQTIWSALASRPSGQWRSRGWWEIAPQQCSKIMTRPLDGADAHVYAIQEQPGGADRRLRSIATGPAQFCISEAQFDAIGNELCVEQGYAIASFRPVKSEESGARIRLTDADFSAPDPNGLRR